MEQKIADLRQQLPRDSLQLAAELARFSQMLIQAKAFPHAEPVIRDSLAIRQKQMPDKGQTFADSLHTSFVRCDASNQDSLRDAVAGAQLVINAAGPFQAKDYSIPQGALNSAATTSIWATGASMLPESANFTKERKIGASWSVWARAQPPRSHLP
jgi:hypothetical protein